VIPPARNSDHQWPAALRPGVPNVTTTPALPSQTIGDANSGIPWRPGCPPLVQHNRVVGRCMEGVTWAEAAVSPVDVDP
jgi:hypothetical protein